MIFYIFNATSQTFSPLPGTSLTHLPRGLSMSLSISYHDNTGSRFNSVGLGTDYRPSRYITAFRNSSATLQITLNLCQCFNFRFDSVVVTESQNNTLSVELTKEEFTVLRSWGGGLEDFIVFRVAGGIAPTSLGPVFVGDFLDLDSLVAGPDPDAVGRWSVEPAGMAKVDKDTGVATLLRGGPVRFSYFLDASSDDANRQRRRATLDVVAEVPSRLALEQVQLVTRTPEAQFVPFSTRVAADQPSNFHGIVAKQEGEVPADGDQVVVPTDLFECHASFTSRDSKLQDVFVVDAVFNFDLRYVLTYFHREHRGL